MPGQIRIGTSGWNYDHWRGPFYPQDLPRKDWFGHYAAAFDTVEINNTFYRQPADALYDEWRRHAPTGFLYAVKANRYLTHLKRLKDPREPLERFLQGVRRLKDRLGPILYQLPPYWNPNLPRLQEFIQLLPAGLRHAVEFRNRDWLCEQTYALLADHGVGLCVHDMLHRHPRRVTAPLVYLRFHVGGVGSGRKYGGRYPQRRLRAWADWIKGLPADCDVFAYFNNDENAHAPADAARLIGLVRGEK